MGLLDGKVAVVTGAGGGLGREHVMALAAEGAAVVVNDLGGARDGTGGGTTMADQVVADVKAAGGEAAVSYSNVATMEGGQAILKTALDAFDKVDVLINNAGILRDKSFKNTTEDLWDPVVQVHLKGTYCVTHAIYNHMVERGEGGAILFISSVHAFLPVPDAVPYNTAKAGINHMALTIANELSAHRIRVNVIEPGWIDTPGEREFFSEEEIVERGKQLPWGRLGSVEDMGRAATYLCSDAADYVTGSVLRADGGFRFWY